ncbi:DUF6069 family protein [Micromonospora inositola]|uniref:Uncharacterized protein n=1 Tax=Micromonospora inositola TaxID=47865 RepID=A0A1C5JKN7_9ACTN|nr:DUF6069 family protein [Micromonospora inositola]SCG71043.1 hypothetical protein GA0070613_4851 [Micromonospora inositola]
MNTVTTGQPRTASVVRPARRGARALAVLVATAAALAVWVVAVPLAGVDLAVRSGATEQPVGPGAVAVAALLAGLAAWALLAVLERFSRRARSIWTGVALAVLLASMLAPLGGGVGAAAKLTLALMHLAAALVIPGLRRTAAAR